MNSRNSIQTVLDRDIIVGDKGVNDGSLICRKFVIEKIFEKRIDLNNFFFFFFFRFVLSINSRLKIIRKEIKKDD